MLLQTVQSCDLNSVGETHLKYRKRIYCVEGIHDWGGEAIEPSVEPMLQLLHYGIGSWEYVRRDCATESEFKWFIQNEWWKRCKYGSILYFSSHGSPGVVNLSNNENVDIGQLELLLDGDGEGGLEQCIVHFGGCRTMQNENRIKSFMDKTGAWAVSGYGKESGWDGVAYNGLALELMFLSSLHKASPYEIEVGNNRHKKRLEQLGTDLSSRFEPLDFKILISS